MPDREKVIKELEGLRDICNAKSNMAIGKGKIAWAGHANAVDDAFTLLKEQEANMESVVRCKDCSNWIPGHITDDDDFIPPKCGKYQQMVGHSADDYCSLAERE